MTPQVSNEPQVAQLTNESSTTGKRQRAAPMSPEDRRAAIIAAVIPLVRQHGLDVTTRQIADAAGIAEGTIFRAFDDKDILLRHAVEAALDPTDAENELRTIDPAAPLELRVEAAAHVLQRRMTDVLELASAVGFSQLRGHDDAHHIDRQGQYARLNYVLEALFEADRDQLTCPPADAARYLRLLAFGGSHPRLTEGRPLTTAEITSLLLGGIRRHTTT